jgi:hypothetical protein
MTVKQIFPRILAALGLISMVLVCTPAALATTTVGTLECGNFSMEDPWGACNRTEKTNIDELHNKKTVIHTWTDTATGEAVKQIWVRSMTPPYNILSEAEERTSPSGESHGFSDDWQNNKHTKFATDAAGNTNKNVYDGDNRLISHSESRSDGSARKETYDPQTGRPTKIENYGRDGKPTSTVVYNPDGSSKTTTYSPDGTVTVTNYGPNHKAIEKSQMSPDGTITVTKYGPDGKAVAKSQTDGKTGKKIVYNCFLKDVFGNEECVDMSRREPQGLGHFGSARGEPRT